MARLTQTQAIQHKATEIKNAAKVAGAQCGLMSGLEAATILEHAYAQAMAEMIGPGASPERVQIAVRKMQASAGRLVPAYCVDLFGGSLK